MSFRSHHRAPARTKAGHTFFSLGVGLLLLAWIAAPGPTVPMTDCELAFEPGQVQAGSESTTVQAVPSEEIGEVTGVTVDRGSGLAITLADGPPLHLDVNASEANEGEWTVTLNREEEALCSGPLTVLADGR